VTGPSCRAPSPTAWLLILSALSDQRAACWRVAALGEKARHDLCRHVGGHTDGVQGALGRRTGVQVVKSGSMTASGVPGHDGPHAYAAYYVIERPVASLFAQGLGGPRPPRRPLGIDDGPRPSVT